ncbi:hypothetical protein PPSIR1_10245 [Plesiocystis pacifica SIR-1]|uniref:PDZ domain-containing protein n=1 Tax=Plesiocystis pacifica SIR-1 TaxID=391625 RepID=A6GFF1_9BACT|nr:hypothetical protein [Plesiocystis pacifica]EDM75378.1 hypothetical protein PPSIR1_10245 [Plesiocystis pacifica SIR-1]
MRAHLALPVMLLALACRPSPSAEAPARGEDGDNQADPAQGDVHGDGDVERPPRPESSIYRGELTRATRDGSPAYLLAQLGPEPYRPQGRFEGWVITRLWPEDPELCAPGCDLQVGDVLLSVNGSTLESPEALSALLERMDSLKSIDVRGIRAGEYYERSYAILADPPVAE